MRTQVSYSNQCSDCCTAAAYSSARICRILDTAAVLVVSIFLLLAPLF